jgi:outer membrane protein OmpA-like peptidoglycan-associated protein
MLGVAGSRISTVGLGESNPVASNDTDEGRRQNRRVEIAIFANDKLKDAATNGKLG